MGVGQPGSYLLKLFGAHVAQAFEHVPYQVGSSLTQKRDWRDVDVRLMLPDAEYEAFFGPPTERNHFQGTLAAWNLAWSVFGQSMTNLPIDFQFQHTTTANAEFDGIRSALLLADYELPTAKSG